MKRKVVIAGLMADTNLGDQIIADAFTALIKEFCHNEEKSCDCWINDGYKFGRENLPEESDSLTKGGGMTRIYLNSSILICTGANNDVKITQPDIKPTNYFIAETAI